MSVIAKGAKARRELDRRASERAPGFYWVRSWPEGGPLEVARWSEGHWWRTGTGESAKDWEFLVLAGPIALER